MIPKPAHLGAEYAAQFKDRSMVEAYSHRPQYPVETFEILAGLIGNAPRVVLDIGCGRGDLARPLAALVDRVDAVDFSEAMVEQGKSLPGGDRANLNWVTASVEEAALSPPYELVTAGASLHWMEWDIVLPRCAAALAPGGYLAIVNLRTAPDPWSDALTEIIARYSTNRENRPYNLLAELELRGLYRKVGEIVTAPVPWTPSVESYVEAYRSMNGFSRGADERGGGSGVRPRGAGAGGWALPHRQGRVLGQGACHLGHTRPRGVESLKSVARTFL